MKNLLKGLAVVAGVTMAGSAFAESDTGNAHVTILDTITFVEDQIVEFNSITGGTGTCSMAAGGVLSGLCAGAPNGTPGQFTVTGTANQAVDISVGSGSTDTGVTYSPLLASNGTTSDSTTLNGTGNATINIIGDLNLVAATGGDRNLTYTITVDYQ